MTMTLRLLTISVISMIILVAFKTDPKTERIGSTMQVIHRESEDFLTWDDFKGKPNYKSHISALCASAIEYSYECSGPNITYEVNAIFIPKESWVQPDAKTEYILAHEHLHFNITELYARKLRKKLKEEIRSCRDSYKIERIAKGIIREWKAEQLAYDKDTHHSIKKDAQRRWDTKVARDLKRYAAFQ